VNPAKATIHANRLSPTRHAKTNPATNDPSNQVHARTTNTISTAVSFRLGAHAVARSSARVVR